jgi:hypothetical protein
VHDSLRLQELEQSVGGLAGKREHQGQPLLRKFDLALADADATVALGARQPYEFGVKVSLAITEKLGLIIGARAFPGNPYDGHTLAEQLEQSSILLQDLPGTPQPKTILVDLGFRGVDPEVSSVHLIHRGKHKALTSTQRRWLKRRQAIEPIIGHVKHDHGMRRCWLKGQTGDALHAVLCATGYNLRWLLRAIVRLGLGPIFFYPRLAALDRHCAVASAVCAPGTLSAA